MLLVPLWNLQYCKTPSHLQSSVGMSVRWWNIVYYNGSLNAFYFMDIRGHCSIYLFYSSVILYTHIINPVKKYFLYIHFNLVCLYIYICVSLNFSFGMSSSFLLLHDVCGFLFIFFEGDVLGISILILYTYLHFQYCS